MLLIGCRYCLSAVVYLLQADTCDRQLWMSLSPVVRRRVSELSHVTSVVRMERLVHAIKFFDSVNMVQLNGAFCCTDFSTLRQIMGTSCSPSTLIMMHTLILFLIRHYSGRNWALLKLLVAIIFTVYLSYFVYFRVLFFRFKFIYYVRLPIMVSVVITTTCVYYAYVIIINFQLYAEYYMQ